MRAHTVRGHRDRTGGRDTAQSRLCVPVTVGTSEGTFSRLGLSPSQNRPWDQVASAVLLSPKLLYGHLPLPQTVWGPFAGEIPCCAFGRTSQPGAGGGLRFLKGALPAESPSSGAECCVHHGCKSDRVRKRSRWGPRLPQSQVGWQTGSPELALLAWPRDFRKHLSEEWHFARPGGLAYRSRLNRPPPPSGWCPVASCRQLVCGVRFRSGHLLWLTLLV